MKSEQLRNKVLAADLAWIPLALAAEQIFRSGFHCRELPLGPSNFVTYVVVTVLAWVLLSENMHLDGFRGGWRLSSLVSHLLLAVAVLMVILLAVENFSDRYLGRFSLSRFALLLLAGFLAIRWLVLRAIFRRHRRGDVHRVVILGSDRLAKELAEKFNHHPELLCRVIGFLCPGADSPGIRPLKDAAFDSASASISTVDLIGLLRQHGVDELVMAHTPASTEILNLVALCRQQAIQVSLVPQPYELYLSRPRLLDLGGLPLLQLGDTPGPATAGAAKRVLDLVLGFLLAVATSPVLATAALALYLSTGSALRWETRIGWRGAKFSMLRLNVDHDPQGVSRFERMLWQFSVTELPQLWNVFRGEMSLVGPRPESSERANRYSAWQQQRLSMKPGMTGLAQVRGLREQHTSEDKTRYDLQYMLHPSLLKDLSLLIETMWTLTMRLIRLLRQPHPGHPAPEPAPQTFSYLSGVHPFPEIYRHAHRTQPGSD